MENIPTGRCHIPTLEISEKLWSVLPRDVSWNVCCQGTIDDQLFMTRWFYSDTKTYHLGFYWSGKLRESCIPTPEEWQKLHLKMQSLQLQFTGEPCY